MLAEKSPLPIGWPLSELKGYREPPNSSTYTYFEYDELALLPEDQFRGEFQWLARQPECSNVAEDDVEYWLEYVDELRANAAKKLPSLKTKAERIGLSIPESFLTFMGNAKLIGRIRSCTDCYFEHSQRIAPNPNGDGYFIHFLSDSQGCIFWNLFVEPSGDHCVVASSGYYFGDNWDPADPYHGNESGKLFFCSPSFESFVYRFWLENEIWYQLSWHKRPLTELQQRYVDYYRQG